MGKPEKEEEKGGEKRKSIRVGEGCLLVLRGD